MRARTSATSDLTCPGAPRATTLGPRSHHSSHPVERLAFLQKDETQWPRSSEAPSACPCASTSAHSSREARASHPPIQVGRSGGRGRVFVDAQRAAREPPADPRHPGVRCAVAGTTSWPPGRPPPGKMGPRAPRVDARGGTEVLPEVEQHVHHARPHLSRRREWSGVIPIADDPPLAAEDAVDGERQSNREPVHAAAGTARLIALDDEVAVVLLDREVNHPEAIDRRPRDGASERSEHAWRAKRRQAGRCSDGDLHRVARVHLGSGDVRHRRSAARLSARPLASPAPGSGRRERQPHLPRSSRLDSAHVPFSARVASGCVARSFDSADVRVGRCPVRGCPVRGCPVRGCLIDAVWGSNRRPRREYGRGGCDELSEADARPPSGGTSSGQVIGLFASLTVALRQRPPSAAS